MDEPAVGLLNPGLVEIVTRQMRSLKLIYLVISLLLVAIIIVTLFLDAPDQIVIGSRWWIEVIFGGLGLILLGLILPLVRKRLLSPELVEKADRETMVNWGLPEFVDLLVGRQAVYLTRFSAGCVVSWGLAVAVGLYGLVARMLGSSPLMTGFFFAAAVFALALLPPSSRRLEKILASFE